MRGDRRHVGDEGDGGCPGQAGCAGGAGRPGTGAGEAAAAELAAAGGPAPRLEVADLASMGQVRTLADRLGTLERIDVLVNNAGLMAGQRRVTADGFDEVFAVNHLAPFLLTNLLLGKLAAAPPGDHGDLRRAHRGPP